MSATVKLGSLWLGAYEDGLLFLRYLGGPSQYYLGDSAAGAHGTVFNSVSDGVRHHSHRLKVRGHSRPDLDPNADPPLFSGFLMCKSTKEHEGFSLRPEARLYINPTRALNLSEKLAGIECQATWQEILLANRPHERGLDGKDNILPQNIGIERREAGLRRYLEAICEALDTELHRSFQNTTQDPPPQTLGFTQWSLRETETYWDITVSNAPMLLAELVGDLIAYHAEYREVLHNGPQHAVGCAGEGNARSITLFLSKTTRLVVYAKTGSKLRFEVRDKVTSTLLPRRVHTSSEALMESLTTIRGSAARRVNHLLAYLKARKQGAFLLRVDAAYAAHWLEKLGRNSEALELLDILMLEGRVAGGAALSETARKLLQKAVRLDLLAWTGPNSHVGSYQPQTLILSERQGSCVSHPSETQTPSSVFVTPSLSTVASTEERVLPSPLSDPEPHSWATA